MIKFENVCKHYRKNGNIIPALDNVSFEIPAGQLALVRGPSGSGKTTMINLAAGLCRQTKGSITIGDMSLDNLPPNERAKRRTSDIAVVFQLFHLVPYLSALENVLLPTLAASRENADERARMLLDELGLSERLTHFPDEMSAGERQRCALARALFNEPEIILADEPTGNLDPESAEKVLRQIDQAKQRGATVLLVSHQPIDHIHPDMILEMDRGNIIE